MSPSTSRRIVTVVGALLGAFGACRNYGDYAPSAGGGAGQGGSAGEQVGGGGTTGTGGSAGGGTAGAAGKGGASGSEQGGVAGDGPGGAGSAGEDSPGGAGPECWSDQNIVPECYSVPPPDQSARVDMVGARSAVVAAIDSDYGRFQLFATREAYHEVGTTFTRVVDHSIWLTWSCFDAVPYPVRLAATTLSNDAPEVFVTTECGRVYVRRYFVGAAEIWSPWLPLDLPSNVGFVTDVSTSRGDANYVFLVDRAGKVFAAAKTDPYGRYAPWHEVATGAGRGIASGFREDGFQQLFTLDDHGHVLTSVQTDGDLDSFGDWLPFGEGSDLAFVDIDAPYGMNGALRVYAVDRDGAIWMREQEGDGFGAWQEFTDLEPPPETTFVGIAGARIASRPDGAFLLVTVARQGTVHLARFTNTGGWEPWHTIP